MAALTLTQLKTAYQGAISSTTIGQTFAIRDYLLYRIYENTYQSSNPVGSALAVVKVQADTVALLETAVNSQLQLIATSVKNIAYGVDENGLPCAWINYYL